MSFENLPEDWPERPLTDPDLLVDVFDLFIRSADRHQRVLHALLTGAGHTLLTPIAIDDMPRVVDMFEKMRTVRGLVDVGRHFGLTGLALAICRPGSNRPTPDELEWVDVLSGICEDNGVTDLGCHLATQSRVSRLSPVGASTATQ